MKILNYSDKAVVIGIIKCGQVSLVNYLQKQVEKPGNIHRLEVATHPDGPRAYSQRYKDWIPIIITRDPVERCWSQYWFFGINNKITYKQYLNLFETHAYFGNINPLHISNYEHHISVWKKEFPNLIVLKLEDLRKEPDFPHDNKKEHEPMPESLRKYTEDKLNEIIKNNTTGGGVLVNLK